MINVLVTGGAGFIGSHLADFLLKLDYNVVVLDDLSGGFIENVDTPYPRRNSSQPDIHFVRGSVLDVQLIEELFIKYKFTYVYHLSAYAAEGLSHFIKRFNYTNNLIGSINLINASVNHGVSCFVFTSSMAVYGSTQVPFSESTDPKPEDSYGIAKLAVERELEICHNLFGLNYVIFRPHNVIGPRQNIWDRYRNVAGIFMRQVLANEPVTIFGSGNQLRAFTYIDDIVPVIAQSPMVTLMANDTFNIGSDRVCSIIELASHIHEILNRPLLIEHIEARDEVFAAWSRHTKLKNALSYYRETPLREALEKMAQWVVTQEARPLPTFDNIEIIRNLPPSWSKPE
jgi:UDP-glucose 4-epimerase